MDSKWFSFSVSHSASFNAFKVVFYYLDTFVFEKKEKKSISWKGQTNQKNLSEMISKLVEKKVKRLSDT